MKSGTGPYLRWYRRGLLAAGTVGAVWILWRAGPVLTPFGFAVVIAYLLAPTVDRMSRAGVNRVAAILVVYAVVGLVIAALILYVVPILVQESVRVIRMVPEFAARTQASWDYWLARFHQTPIPPSIRAAINQTGTHVQSQLFSLLKGAMGTLFGLVPGLLSLVVAPVLAFYLLKDLDRVRRRFWAMVPVDWQAAVFKLGVDIDRALGGFIRGQLVVAVVVGALTAAWMQLLGIPFALLIGAVAGISDIIPYVGPIVGALPAVALGLTLSPWSAVYAVGGLVAIHQLEGTVIGPKVVGESVGLHPLVVIFAILAGGELGGLAGLLLAVPTAAVLKVIFTHLYRRSIL